MRLKSVAIKQFRNLNDFSVSFDETDKPTVIMGQNGTGKSNFFEAVTTIFRTLRYGRLEASEFPFSITYEHDGKTVCIECKEAQNGKYTYTGDIDGTPISNQGVALPTFQGRVRYCLPQTIFCYYSGLSARMEHLFRKPLRDYRDAMRKGEDVPLNMVLADRIHSQFVLLSFFAEDDPQVHRFLNDELGIEDIESVLFIFKDTNWKKGSAREFWGAEGIVRKFLDDLIKFSVAPILLPQTVDLEIGKTEKLDHAYLYIKDRDTLRKAIKRISGSEEDVNLPALFRVLESARVSNLIAEVRIRVKKRGLPEPITFTSLSEGEQQLLMVLGMLRFTRGQEALFLLDEPDTHLNPAWSAHYFKHIHNAVKSQKNSHFIMATHDPLVISGLKKEDVLIFRQNVETGTVEARNPEEDPQGQGIAGLLVSDVYGLKSALDEETYNELDRKRQLSRKSDDELTDRDRRELARLSKKLEGIDSVYVRDPLYREFVDAYYDELNGTQKPADETVEQRIERRKGIANKIMNRLMADRRGEA